MSGAHDSEQLAARPGEDPLGALDVIAWLVGEGA